MVDASITVYPREGTTYPDAAGVSITYVGAIVDTSKYIRDAIRAGFLLTWDPLGVYQPEDRRSDGGVGEVDVGIQSQLAFALRSIAVGTNAVDILGCSTAGDGGGGLFRRITSDFPPVGVGGAQVGVVTIADGSKWVYVPDPRGVNARAFGAHPDASGAVNAQAIQNALIFDMYYAKCGVVYIPGGDYDVDETIHVGYGVDGFYGTSLEGDGRFGIAFPPSGTILRTTKSDRPCISVQGGRSIKIRALSLSGPNLSYLQTNALGYLNPPVNGVDDLDVANWISPSMDAKFNGRYTPCAAIAIDPYSGPQPVDHYPDVYYPPFLGAVSQYNKNFTSAVAIEDVYAEGFCVPVAVQPCDADGNGDFVYLRDCVFSYNVYGVVSVGNTQSRSLSGDNLNTAQFHTAITNSTHGRQTGKIGADWRNCTFGACIQWLDVPAAGYAGAVRFVGCYGEVVWRLGVWGSNAATNCPLSFEACEISFDGQTNFRGIPVNLLEATATNVSIRSSTFTNYASTCGMGGQARFFSIDGLQLGTVSSRTNTYEKIAHNFLSGGIMFNPQEDGKPSLCAIKPVTKYNLDSGANIGTSVTANGIGVDRTSCVPAWISTACNANTIGADQVIPPLWQVYAKTTFAVSLTGRTLTLTLPGGFQPSITGTEPGDVIFDDNTQLVFFIRSRVGSVVTAVLQNGYKNSVVNVPFSSTVGNFYFGNARAYLTQYYLNATFSTGSTTVSSVARADGYGGIVTTNMANGDFVFVWPSQYKADFSFSDSAATISSLTDGSPGSLVLGAVPLRSETRSLGFLIRKPPANV